MIIATTNIDEDAGSHRYNFYVRDYLGSVRAVVGANGELWQFNDYHVTGIPSSQFGQLNADDRLHTGKEYNAFNGLHMYDNNARTQDPILGRFTTPDPLAEKYPNFSPYAHCANNPLKYMDPDGRKLEFAKGVSDSFKADYTKATNHLNSNNAGEMIAKIEASEKVYYINESTNMESKYNSGTKTIDWSPNTAIRTDNLYELSPAEILNHEIDHALQNDQNPEQQTKDSETKDPNYRNKEEKRVVEGSEKQTAIKLNKLKDGEVTRNNLFGNPYKTKGPTSTEGVDELVITPK